MDDVAGSLEVPIVCEVCGTTSRVPLETANEAVERHNRRMHDGEAVAAIDPAIKDELATLVAEDLKLL